MNIDYTKTGTYTAQIEVTLGPSDYKDSYESELKKYQKKTNLKGFRKGKTPKSMIKKMYGTAILSDIVTKKLQESLFEYLDGEKIETLGQPIPSESQKPIRFEAGQDLDYTFDFDLGLKPEFDLPDLSEPLQYYDVAIPEESVDKELEALQRRGGHRDKVVSEFEEGDMIAFNAWELEDGEIKEEGLETSFELMVDMMDEDFKSKVLELESGDTFDFDIFKAEKDLSEEGVRKYLMQLEEDELDREVNPEFRFKIEDGTRQVLAELDEEFLTMAFGDDITTEEEARDYIRGELKKDFETQADNMVFQVVHDKLMEETEIDLPADFLKRWLLVNQSEQEHSHDHDHDHDHSHDHPTPEEIEDRYENEFKDSLRWQLISDKISQRYDITITDDEIVQELGRRIRQFLPSQQLTGEVYNQVLQSLANDEQQVQEARTQVRIHKMFTALKADLVLDMEEISQDDFNEKVKEFSKAQQEKNQEEEDELIGDEWDDEEE